jgi:POT family proton-dependent oligopeptide transporter
MVNYKEMPKGVFQINIIQIFSTVGYAVLMGLLNFYLTDHGGFTKTEANTLTASFFALNFLLHFLGGTLGGKFFSFRGLFLISLSLQVISMFMIAEHNQTIIIYGMALFITGAGLNVSCINMMLTQLFKSKRS